MTEKEKHQTIARAVMNRYCEIMEEHGGLCHEGCDCWKMGLCDDAQGLENVVMCTAYEDFPDPRDETIRQLREALKETENLFDPVREIHPGHPAYELAFVDRQQYDDWCKKRRAALERKE